MKTYVIRVRNDNTHQEWAETRQVRWWWTILWHIRVFWKCPTETHLELYIKKDD